jgi:hypothetical protein
VIGNVLEEKELEEILKIGSLADMRQRGTLRIPHVRIGRSIRYYMPVVEKWLEENSLPHIRRNRRK